MAIAEAWRWGRWSGRSAAMVEGAVMVTLPVTAVLVPSSVKLVGLKLQVTPERVELQLSDTVPW